MKIKQKAGKKSLVVVSVLLLAATLLTGCTKARLDIQKPADGWYGQEAHKAVTYDEIKEHRFDESKLMDVLDRFSAAIKAEGNEVDVLELYQAIIRETDSLGTAMTLSDLNYNADAQNETLAEERLRLTESYYQLMEEVYPALREGLASSYSSALEEKMKKVTTQEEIDSLKEYRKKSDEELVLARQEQELTQQYDLAMQKDVTAEVDGETWTAAKLQKNPPEDMALTYRINEALMQARTDEVGEILQELVTVRTAIAKAHGYDNYTDYAYKEMYHRDYTTDEIQKVYSSVKKYFVPLYGDIQKSGADIDWSVLSSNKIKPEDELLDALTPYFGKIDPELAESFGLLRESHTFDIANVKGKNNISFATKLYSYDIPFLFIRPSGYVQDSTILVHEFGHWNTMLHSRQPMLFEGKNHDVAEINSQGLELLFLEYADELWGEGADAFRYNTILKLCSSVLEGCLYDEFQNALYAKPDINTDEISKLFLKLSKEYGFANKNADEWIQVAHTFSFPLYYISYATSGLSSLDLYVEAQTDRQQAINRYMALSAIGMTGSYRESMTATGMKDIFESGSVKSIAKDLRQTMDLE